MTIGKNIQRIRRTKTVELRMTLSDLANLAGLHSDTIRKIERSETHPSPKALAKIAKALGVTVAELMKETE